MNFILGRKDDKDKILETNIKRDESSDSIYLDHLISDMYEEAKGESEKIKKSDSNRSLVIKEIIEELNEYTFNKESKENVDSSKKEICTKDPKFQENIGLSQKLMYITIGATTAIVLSEIFFGKKKIETIIDIIFDRMTKHSICTYDKGICNTTISKIKKID